jgi:hypothetical protein
MEDVERIQKLESLFQDNAHKYSLLVEGFCLFALLPSFVLSRIYVYSKKRPEEVKMLSGEEKRFLRHEYLGKFLFPHIFWIGSYVFFHLLMT